MTKDEALAQPEQEPVAWITNNGDGWLRWHRAKDNNSNSIPLYATPPQRTWIGLTDEEANELWESTDSDWELMKRTEAKLKEKNHG